MKKKQSEQSNSNIKMGKSNRTLMLICYLCIAVFAILCLFPFALMITSSFMTEREIVAEGYKLFPKNWSLSAYRYLLDNPTKLLSSYRVTITITVVGTAIGLFIMSLAGYVLNRKDFNTATSFPFSYISLHFSVVDWFQHISFMLDT